MLNVKLADLYKQERPGNSPLDQNVWVTCGRKSSCFFPVFSRSYDNVVVCFTRENNVDVDRPCSS